MKKVSIIGIKKRECGVTKKKFDVYISKQVHPNKGLSSRVGVIMNSLGHHLIDSSQKVSYRGSE